MEKIVCPLPLYYVFFFPFTANAGILLEHAPACPEQYGVQVCITYL